MLLFDGYFYGFGCYIKFNFEFNQLLSYLINQSELSNIIIWGILFFTKDKFYVIFLMGL